MISNRVNIGPSPFVSTGSSGTSTNPRLSPFAVRTWSDEYGRPSFLVVLFWDVRDQETRTSYVCHNCRKLPKKSVRIYPTVSCHWILPISFLWFGLVELTSEGDYFLRSLFTSSIAFSAASTPSTDFFYYYKIQYKSGNRRRKNLNDI